MRDSANMMRWEITDADDMFHDEFDGSDHPWWCESFWVSFNIPERKMGGWFYNQVLKNQGEHGICNGGAWVWDDSDSDYLYQLMEMGLPLPPGPRDLRDISLPNGNTIKCLEPLKKYQVTYSDAGKFEANLIFEGVCPPNPHPIGVAPFWKGRHFDQPMHVTGKIVLNGETLAVDCYSVRDRSWSPRKPHKAAEANDASGGKLKQRQVKPSEEWTDITKPPKKRFNIGYIFGTASPDEAFLVYTMVLDGEEDRGDFTNTGYLIRDGVKAHIVEGQRKCLVDPDKGYIWRIEYEGVDELGRTVKIEGELVANHGTGTGLFYWKWDGTEGWGENQGGIDPSYPRVPRNNHDKEVG